VVGPLRKPELVSYAEYERYIFLDALSQMPLEVHGGQSHLFAFVPVPPCSEEKMRNLERQVKFLGLLEGKRKKEDEIPLTGWVNSPDDQRLYNFLKNRAELKARTMSGKAVFKKGGGQKDETVQVVHDNEGDVGDVAVVMMRKGKEKEKAVLVGESNAIFVRKTNEKDEQ